MLALLCSNVHCCLLGAYYFLTRLSSLPVNDVRYWASMVDGCPEAPGVSCLGEACL